jgi:polysaccharide export outer membrane protein
MAHTDSSRKITQPVVGVTLLAAMAIFCPSPSLAQSPIIEGAAPTPTTTSPPVDLRRAQDAYTLGPGDQIQIDIFNVPEYSGENGRYQVLVDGSLNLPLIGNVRVQGLTLNRAASTISARYARFLKRPITTVTLIQPRPLRVAIAGEVNNPGSYSISLNEATGQRTGGNQNGATQFPTVTRAIQTAGGITRLADVRQIQVRRPQRSGSDQVINVNLWEFIQTGDLRRDLILRDGDTIVIPTVSSVNLAEQRTLDDVNFAADATKPINVAVVGEVYRPGPQTVTGTVTTGQAGETGQQSQTTTPPTVTRALQVAGGIKPRADIRNVQIRRQTRSGAEQTINANLFQLLQAGDARQDVILQEGDTVFIPTATTLSPEEETRLATTTFAPATIRVNVVGEVKAPGVVEIQPSTPLNQGVLAAGGFDNRRAKKSEVELVRLEPNGTVSRRTIPIDFTKGVNEATNPALRNNDVVIVGRSGLTAFSDNLSNVLTPITGGLGILRIFGGF